MPSTFTGPLGFWKTVRPLCFRVAYVIQIIGIHRTHYHLQSIVDKLKVVNEPILLFLGFTVDAYDISRIVCAREHFTEGQQARWYIYSLIIKPQKL